MGQYIHFANGKRCAVRGYDNVTACFPTCKDWNENLKTAKGISQAEPVSARKPDENMLDELAKDSSPEKGRLARIKIPALLGQRNRYLQLGVRSKANECLMAAASYAISAAMREYRQIGESFREEDAAAHIKAAYMDVDGADRLAGNLSNIQKQAQGIHTAGEKRRLAESWLTFAAQCLGVMESTRKLQRAVDQGPTMAMGGIRL